MKSADKKGMCMARQDVNDMLDTLDNDQLKQVIIWTINDLSNAMSSSNYEKLDDKIKGWCAMLHEAVIYQISKACKANDNWYESEE
tara:strand:+ start:361 stop:618 length:258 start_codon:yes stop_codon:yes gene_type:complete